MQPLSESCHIIGCGTIWDVPKIESNQSTVRMQSAQLNLEGGLAYISGGLKMHQI